MRLSSGRLCAAARGPVGPGAGEAASVLLHKLPSVPTALARGGRVHTDSQTETCLGRRCVRLQFTASLSEGPSVLQKQWLAKATRVLEVRVDTALGAKEMPLKTRP